MNDDVSDSFEAQMLLNQFATTSFTQLSSETRFSGSNAGSEQPENTELKVSVVKKLRQPMFIQNKILPQDPSAWSVQERVGVEQLARLKEIPPEAVDSLCKSLLPLYEPISILEAVEKYKSEKYSTRKNP